LKLGVLGNETQRAESSVLSQETAAACCLGIGRNLKFGLHQGRHSQLHSDDDGLAKNQNLLCWRNNLKSGCMIIQIRLNALEESFIKCCRLPTCFDLSYSLKTLEIP
jgi:hypothetical protein